MKYSEKNTRIRYVYTVLFTFLGVMLYIRSLDTPSISKLKMLMAGFLVGLGVWLRLEGILLFFSIGCGFLFVYKLKDKNEFNRFILFGVGFLLTTLAFFIFNLWDYGHILGPRYLANKSGFTQTAMERTIQTITLLFAGKYKVGYFGFTPLFLVCFIYENFIIWKDWSAWLGIGANPCRLDRKSVV